MFSVLGAKLLGGCCCSSDGPEEALEYQTLLHAHADTDEGLLHISPRGSPSQEIRAGSVVPHVAYAAPWYPAALAGDQEEPKLVSVRPSVNMFVEAGNSAVSSETLSSTVWKAVVPYEPVMFGAFFANASTSDWYAFFATDTDSPMIACAVQGSPDTWKIFVHAVSFQKAAFSAANEVAESLSRQLHAPCVLYVEGRGEKAKDAVANTLYELGICASRRSLRMLFPCPPAFVQDIAKLDRQTNIPDAHKAGILLCTEGQLTEQEWYSNQHATPAFERFLNRVGDTVLLEGFVHYRGGLDVISNKTGRESVHVPFYGRELMYHVSTMLPYSDFDEQQLERKRHIGNDIVVVIFKDGRQQINPILQSQYNHVFIVVEEVDGGSFYKIEVVSEKVREAVEPVLPTGGLVPHHLLRDFLTAKVINSEWAAFSSPEFSSRLSRANNALLSSLQAQYEKFLD